MSARTKRAAKAAAVREVRFVIVAAGLIAIWVAILIFGGGDVS